MSRKLDRARKALEEAAGRVGEWEARASELRQQLAAAEQRLGAQAIEIGVEEASRGVADLREQVNAAERAVEAATAARVEAEREALLVEAGDLRDASRELDRQAARHKRRTDELLRQLAEHEEAPERLGDRAYVQNVPQPGVASEVRYWTPKSERLANEAAGLRQKAAALEQRAATLAPRRLEPEAEAVAA